MSNMTLQESLLREIQNLPEDRQADVLAFVRFLKIGLADDQNLDLQFTDALDRAGAISDEHDLVVVDPPTSGKRMELHRFLDGFGYLGLYAIGGL